MLLDANALLLSVRTRFPLDAEVQRIHPGARLAVPSSVLDELDRLIARGVPDARAALALARRYPGIPAAGRGDSAILEAAVRHRGWVVTGDRALAARLRRHGVDVLVPRDRHRLEVRPGKAVRSASPAPPARR